MTIENLLKFQEADSVFAFTANGEPITIGDLKENYKNHTFELKYDEDGSVCIYVSEYSLSDLDVIESLNTLGAVACAAFKRTPDGKRELEFMRDTLKEQFPTANPILIEAVADQVLDIKGKYTDFDAEEIFDSITVEV